uniref:Putative peptidase n=1 Tax=viral metagenome TaxID=1070528 RepID=A0A6H2A112_9ZZZZ
MSPLKHFANSFIDRINALWGKYEAMIWFPFYQHYRISSRYGWRTHPITGKKQFHNGIDISAPEGTPIYAPSGGIISEVWHDAINGNAMRIEHHNGKMSGFAHCQHILLSEGNDVDHATAVATVGNTGRSSGAHLHWTLWKSKNTKDGHVNPKNWFQYRDE